MSQPLAFKATYSDLKIIKGRKVVQFVFEVPFEQSDDAMKILGGIPRADAETWVGIARIDPKAGAQPQERQRVKFSEMKPSAQAAMRCDDHGFRQYLAERSAQPIEDSNSAAIVLRTMLGVKSRAELDTDHEAARRWRQMDDDYFGWQRCPV